MKRPRITIAYGMELVATTAVCVAVARDVLLRPVPPVLVAGWFYPYVGTLWVWGAVAGSLALAGGAGLACEAIRGRRPESWGIGRWIWSIAAVATVFGVLTQFAFLAIHHLRTGALFTFAEFHDSARHEIYTVWRGITTWMLAGVWITSALAGTPRDPEPDIREWLGRIYGGVGIVMNAAWGVIWAFAY
jgi:hypothetical protein